MKKKYNITWYEECHMDAEVGWCITVEGTQLVGLWDDWDKCNAYAEYYVTEIEKGNSPNGWEDDPD